MKILLDPLQARLVALLLLWGHLLYQVHFQWGNASYYNYGWAVPLLTLLLLYNRLECKIPTQQESPAPSPRRNALVIFLILILVPIKILSEVNVFWRVPLFLHALPILLISLIWGYEMLGARNFRHLIFPLLFSLTMLPWPYRIETLIIVGFSEQVTLVTTHALNALGLKATLAGNTIQLGEMTVGVDDACSGIRSLQALLMVALFLGDYFFLSFSRRLFLIVAGILCVFLFNTMRSITLALAYFLVGEDFYDFWHDPVGLITFALSFGVLLVLTLLLANQPPATSAAPAKPLGKITRWVGDFSRYRTRVTWILLALFSILAVEAWFALRSSGKESQDIVHWSLEPSKDPLMNFEELDIPERIASTLSFDYGTRVRGLSKDFIRLEAYYYGYTGENRISSVSSYGHSPLICMNAVGAELLTEAEPVHYTRDGLSLMLEHYIFTYPNRPGSSNLHVFWTLEESSNRGFDPERLQSLDYQGQLKLAFLGRRDYSRKILLVALSGTSNYNRIRSTLDQVLNHWVQVSPQTDHD